MSVACPVCAWERVILLHRETRLVRSAFQARVYRCPRCRLVFAWPQPDRPDQAYEESYLEAYRAAGLGTVAQANLERFGRRLQRVRPEPGRLLEIGVGDGTFMHLAQRLQWDVIGLDVSRWAADQVRRRFGLDVIHGTIEEAPFPDHSFDVIHLSHVLEHVPDPVSVLTRIARLLRPDGRVVIEVPNEFENLYSWVRLRSATARPYKVASTHLWFFTPETLRSVVRLANLSIERARTFRDVHDARALRRLAKVVVSALEAMVDRGPLIELVARPPDGAGQSDGRPKPAT